MCLLKSGLILKDRIFVPDYDSHDRMLSELKIEDSDYNAEHTFIRFELRPKNNDPFTSVDEWTYEVDQDILPDWYVESYDKQRAAESVKAWAKEHILVGAESAELNQGIYYVKNSTVTAYDLSTVKAYNSSTVTAYGSSTVTACDSSTVKAFNSSTVTACDSSTVKAYNSSTVTAYGSSTVTAYDSSTVKAFNSSTVTAFDSSIVVIPERSSNDIKNIVISENSTIKDCKAKTIWQSGNWKINIVGEKNE